MKKKIQKETVVRLERHSSKREILDSSPSVVKNFSFVTFAICGSQIESANTN